MKKQAIAYAAVFVCLWSMPAMAEQIEHARAFEASGSVYINNTKGSVRVMAWDEPRLEVTGSVEGGMENIKIEGSDSRISIEVPQKRPGLWGRKGIEANLVVRVPLRAELAIDTVSASVTVDDIHGPTRIESVSGSVAVTGGPEELEIESVSGSIRFGGNTRDASMHAVSGSIHFNGEARHVTAETVSGAIVLAGDIGGATMNSVSGSIRADGLHGEVEAESVSSTIQIAGGEFAKCSLMSCSGSIRWGGRLGSDGDFEMNTHSGTVVLDFESLPSAEFDVNTFSGTIQADFGGDGRYSAKREWRHDIGGGDGDVEIETFSGSVRIKSK